MNKGIFITVRTGSKRLPNKALLRINGKTTIEYLIDRTKLSQLSNIIVLCTTILPEDDVLCEIANNNNINYYRGSVEDKLDRWKGACEKFNIDFFVTADGDDLFCEPYLMDLAFGQVETSDTDYIKADGIVCGAFTYGIKYTALKKVCDIKDTSDTEMMWTYFEDTGLFNISQLAKIPVEYMRSDIRMTLDYEDDFKFFTNIIECFNGKIFGLMDILSYIDKNPYVSKINIHLQDQWVANQKKRTNLILK